MPLVRTDKIGQLSYARPPARLVWGTPSWAHPLPRERAPSRVSLASTLAGISTSNLGPGLFPGGRSGCARAAHACPQPGRASCSPVLLALGTERASPGRAVTPVLLSGTGKTARSPQIVIIRSFLSATLARPVVPPGWGGRGVRRIEMLETGASARWWCPAVAWSAE